MAKRIKTYLVLLLMILCTITTSLYFVGEKKVKADTNSDVAQIRQVFEEGNTGYTCLPTINEIDDNYLKKQNKVNFSVGSTVKGKDNVTSDAKATVFMHGYGACAGAWSNNVYANGEINVDFSGNTILDYREGNLIEQVKSAFGSNARLYRIEVKSITNTSINNLNENINSYILDEKYSDIEGSKSEIDELTLDSTKHNIFIFDYVEDMSSESNENTYFFYNYAMSIIAKKLSSTKTVTDADNNTSTVRILPKFNLIGHSRGGIINLMYALDHPFMVKNLISIGTPYEGSTSAQIYKFLLEIKNEQVDDALKDIVKSDIYENYRNKWNNNYNTLYKDINANATGSYVSMAALTKMVNNDKSGELGGYINIENNENLAKFLVSAGIVGVCAAKVLLDCRLGIIRALGKRIFVQALREMFPDCVAVAGLQIFYNEIIYDDSFLSWYNDVLVNTSSQLGSQFSGFNRFVKKYRKNITREELEVVSMNDVPVPHNLEIGDKDIIRYITKIFKADNRLCYVDNAAGDGVVITGIIGMPSEVIGKTLVIPETIDGKTVKEIGSYAFDNKLADIGVIKVEIPKTVTKINDYAFFNVTCLMNIILNTDSNYVSSLTHIGEGAFEGCTSLMGMILPNNVTSIGVGILANCTSLSSVTLGNGVKHIPDDTFSNCEKLTSVTMTNATSFGESVFRNCKKLQYPLIPNGVTKLPNYTFYGCEKLYLNSLNNVTEIGENTFYGCRSLNFNASTMQNVTKIGNGAFTDCNFTTFNIPQSVTVMGDNIFNICTNLTNIIVDANNPNYCSVNGVLYNKDKTTLISYPLALTNTSFTVPDSVYSINSYAFTGNTNLVSLNLNNVRNIGLNAFAGCENLANITGDYVEAVSYDSFYMTAWLNQNQSEYVGIGKCLLNYRGQSETVDLSSYVYVDEFAFENKAKYDATESDQTDYDAQYLNVKHIILGENAQFIGKKAFYSCKNLESITIYANSVVKCDSDIIIGYRNTYTFKVPQNLISEYMQTKNYPNATSKYSPITTTVNYYDGETLLKTESINYNDKYTLYEYSPEYATLNGWYDGVGENANRIKTKGVWSNKNAQLNLYALKTARDCKITYVANGGELAKTVDYYSSGEAFTLPVPLKENYVFKGWYFDEELSNFTGNSITSSGGAVVTVYAKWEAVSCNVILVNPLGEEYNGNFGYGENSEFKLPVIQAERSFLGWFTAQKEGNKIADENGIVVGTIYQGITLYARFAPIQITYNLDGATNSIENPAQYDYYPQTFTLQPATKQGFRFMGWKTAKGLFVNELNEYCTENLELYAFFLKEYTLRFYTDEANGVYVDFNVIQGETINLPYAVKTHYNGKWKIKDSLYDFISPYVVNVANIGMVIDGVYVISANWTPKVYFIHYKYTIHYASFPNVTILYGDELKLDPPQTQSGSKFYAYYDNPELTGVPVTKIGKAPDSMLKLDPDLPGNTELFIILYCKWVDIFEIGKYRNEEYAITDSGRFNQPYDELVFTAGFSQDSFYNYYTSIKFKISLVIYERYDGNQHIMLYEEYINNDVYKIREIKIIHGPSGRNYTHHKYEFEFIIPIKDSYRRTTGIYHKFYLLYGASGKYDDDWFNYELVVMSYLTSDPPQTSNPADMYWG